MENKAKEKARELIEKFAPIMPNEDWKVKAKQCAIISVENDIEWFNKICLPVPIEIIEVLTELKNM